MRILICGASGQLGQELVRVLGDGSTEIGQLPSEYRDADVVCSDVGELDITNGKAVENFICSGHFDLIINCAAITNVDSCENQEDVAYRVNAVGSENIAHAAAMSNAKLVHLSTDYVFSGNSKAPYVETDTPSPETAYGRTKLAGEELVARECSSHYIIRTAWLYGYHGPNFVKTMLSLATQYGVIKVVDDQFGNPTSANDLAYEILKIAGTDEYGIYHCTNQGTCSWFEFASAIVDIAGIPCEKIPLSTGEFPRPARRPAFSSLKNKRLEDTIGDEMREWRIALEEYLRNLPKGEWKAKQ